VDENTALELVEGLLDGPARLGTELHLDACADCRALVAHFAREAASERPAPTRGAPPDLIAPPGTVPRPERAPRQAPSSVRRAAGAHDPPPRIGDRYKLLFQLGQGGMGSVWVAEDERLARLVAIKLMIMRGAGPTSKRALGRFEQEAKALARLRSPHIVHVYDYGVADQVPYIVMELLEGEDLRQRLIVRERLPLDEVGRVVVQTARALASAHAAGIVHRDLKPGNIFLVPHQGEEIVKVFDFGVAKALTDLGALPDTTADGVLLGTPRYMSPEQAYGARQVDHRADLWSLGVIAYQALTGEVPFDGQGAGEIITKICQKPFAPPSTLVAGLSPAVDLFFERALAKTLGERYQSARELASELATIAQVSLATGELAAVEDASVVLAALERRSSPGLADRPSGAGEASRTSAPSLPSSPAHAEEPTRLEERDGRTEGGSDARGGVATLEREAAHARTAQRRSRWAVAALVAGGVLAAGAYWLGRGGRDARDDRAATTSAARRTVTVHEAAPATSAPPSRAEEAPASVRDALASPPPPSAAPSAPTRADGSASLVDRPPQKVLAPASPPKPAGAQAPPADADLWLFRHRKSGPKPPR
jgi:serine/threonine protein kinase